MADPVCYVRCCGQSQHTTIENRTLSPYWDQMLFFDVGLTKQQFLTEKLTLQVFNANTFRRNDLIGAFEFDLVRPPLPFSSTLYYSSRHEFMEKTIMKSGGDGLFFIMQMLVLNLRVIYFVA